MENRFFRYLLTFTFIKNANLKHVNECYKEIYKEIWYRKISKRKNFPCYLSKSMSVSYWTYLFIFTFNLLILISFCKVLLKLAFVIALAKLLALSIYRIFISFWRLYNWWIDIMLIIKRFFFVILSLTIHL